MPELDTARVICALAALPDPGSRAFTPCIAGPCAGRSLRPLRLRIVAGMVLLADEARQRD